MITIRHLKIKDSQQLWSFVSDDAITKYLTWKSYVDKKDSDDYLLIATKKKSFPDEVLGICVDDRLVGTIHMISRGGNRVQFGYGILKNEWGNGYATKGSELALLYLRKTWLKSFDAIEVWADVHKKNLAGIGVAEKLGFALMCKNVEPNRDRYVKILFKH